MEAVIGRKLKDQLRPHWTSPVLLRGAGMGGPLSLLTWNISFDPVVWIAQLAACCQALAYVDDLLAEIFGPGQLLLSYLTLLAAAHQASLSIEEHTCKQVIATNGRTEVAEFLRNFPTGFKEEGERGFRLTSGPVELYLDAILRAGILPAGTRHEVIGTNCRCRTKHAVIPSHSPQHWADALAGTPMAPAVTTQATFLGVGLCSRVRPHEFPTPGWTPAALTVCRGITWQSALAKCLERASRALRAGVSLSLRTEAWNTYCVPTIPYAASTILPGRHEKEHLLSSMAILFPTGRWARKELPVQIGAALHIQGGPRDPWVIAHATAISQALSHRFAGPPEALKEIDPTLQALKEWMASSTPDSTLSAGLHRLPSPPDRQIEVHHQKCH